MDRELRAVCDEREINSLINRYCHTMDYGRRQEWLDLFTPDAIYEVRLPDESLYARVVGTEELREFIAGFPRPGLHKHIYATPVFDIDPDAGEATVDVSFMMLSGDGKSVEVSAFGRSRDRVVRTEGGWRFQERRIVTEAMSVPSA